MSIDVVLPCYRLNEAYLLPMLQLRKPEQVVVHFFIVVDNPAAAIPLSVQQLQQRGDISVLVNAENLGAAATRNRGMAAGTGDWILLLDDDIEVPADLLITYAHAAAQFPHEISFIGQVNLPAPINAFTRAIQISGAMDVFGIASVKDNHAWGATANIMLNRSALGDERFSAQFPRSGGGEDVEFGLRLRDKNGGRNYKTLPAAAVNHPWWYNGQVNFTRTFRYGLGNSWLPQLLPEYAYRDFLNTPEILLLSVLALPLVALLKPALLGGLLCFMAGTVAIELLATLVQTIKRSRHFSPAVFFWMIPLRLVYETGLLLGHLQRGRLQGIGERFHDDGKKQKWSVVRTNTHKLVKWVCFPLLVWFCFFRHT